MLLRSVSLSNSAISSIKQASSPSDFLSLSLKLAQQRRGFCSPNPAVGAVLVKNNQVIASAAHYAAGHLHAEQAVLAAAGANARGGILYVSLEPCCHWGKTPPCAELIIQAGISKVYFAMVDPNPEVSGKGLKKLQQAGIACELIAHPATIDFYGSYTFWRQTQRPFVTAKIALSLDGKIAGPKNAPVAITGTALQNYTHEQRRQADAILTTVTTIIQDDPQLNIRLQNSAPIAKPIYILDRELRLPVTAKILQTAATLTLFHQSQVEESRLVALQALGIRCVVVKSSDDGLDLNEILIQIGADGCHDLWVEAGGHCFQSFIRNGLVQRALIYIAPICLGEAAVNAFHGEENIFSQANKIKWQVVGNDAVCELRWNK